MLQERERFLERYLTNLLLLLRSVRFFPRLERSLHENDLTTLPEEVSRGRLQGLEHL